MVTQVEADRLDQVIGEMTVSDYLRGLLVEHLDRITKKRRS